MLTVLKALAQDSPVAHVVTDAEQKALFVNRAFEELCGYEEEELAGRKLGPVLQGEATEPAVVEYVRKQLVRRILFAFSITNYHKDGTMYRALVVVIPVRDAFGQREYFLGVEKKITDEERAIDDPAFRQALARALSLAQPFV